METHSWKSDCGVFNTKGNIASIEVQFCVIYGCVSDGDVYRVGSVVMKGELSVRTVRVQVLNGQICIGQNYVFCNLVSICVFLPKTSPRSTKSGAGGDKISSTVQGIISVFGYIP